MQKEKKSQQTTDSYEVIENELIALQAPRHLTCSEVAEKSGVAFLWLSAVAAASYSSFVTTYPSVTEAVAQGACKYNTGNITNIWELYTGHHNQIACDTAMIFASTLAVLGIAPFSVLAMKWMAFNISHKNFKELLKQASIAVFSGGAMATLTWKYNLSLTGMPNELSYLVPNSLFVYAVVGLGTSGVIKIAIQQFYDNYMPECFVGRYRQRLIRETEVFRKLAQLQLHGDTALQFNTTFLSALGLEVGVNHSEQDVKDALRHVLSNSEETVQFITKLDNILQMSFPSWKDGILINGAAIAVITLLSALGTAGLGVSGLVGSVFANQPLKWIFGLLAGNIPNTILWSYLVTEWFRNSMNLRGYYRDTFANTSWLDLLKKILSFIPSAAFGAMMGYLPFQQRVAAGQSITITDVSSGATSFVANTLAGEVGFCGLISSGMTPSDMATFLSKCLRDVFMEQTAETQQRICEDQISLLSGRLINRSDSGSTNALAISMHGGSSIQQSTGSYGENTVGKELLDQLIGQGKWYARFFSPCSVSSRRQGERQRLLDPEKGAASPSAAESQSDKRNFSRYSRCEIL